MLLTKRFIGPTKSATSEDGSMEAGYILSLCPFTSEVTNNTTHWLRLCEALVSEMTEWTGQPSPVGSDIGLSIGQFCH